MKAKHSSFHVRAYHAGDEEEIVRLFNLVHKDYAGFVPRTRSYWLWCCRERPDVDDDGIVVVEEDYSNEIVGYAVSGKSGNIWELCVNSDLDKKYIVSLLLEKATEYLTAAGSDRIFLNVPANDSCIEEACKQLSFAEFPVEQVFMAILDFEVLMELLAKSSVDKLRLFNEVFSVRLRNARSWVNPRFAIKIDNGQINIAPYMESNCILTDIDADTLTSIMLGETKPFKALVTGKLKVRPRRKTFRTLKFLSAIRIRDPWFYPRADFG